MSYYPEFSRILNEGLVRLDRSPAWLARRLDVNPSTVNRWLNHGSRPGDSDSVVRIADILGMRDQRQELLIAAGYGYQELRSPVSDENTESGIIQTEKLVSDTAIPDMAPPAAVQGLTAQVTPLVGRDEELTALSEMSGDPAVRLMTVLGPGGMGKTSLAQALAQQQAETGRYRDGVFFVSLAATTERQGMVTAIADALGLSVAGSDVEQSIINQLCSHSALIILDNFEQLVSEADYVATLLYAAPHVKLVMTSRVRLNLHEEWVLELQGLAYPPAHVTEELANYDAVTLFVQRAGQMNSRFIPSAEQLRSVADICRLVQGMPLALELAAGWTRVLSPEEIAQEIEQSIDLFTTTVRNVPERHRSLRAVFWQSWQMLTEPEQNTYAMLSVFRGGFGREAASQVTGVSLPVLTSLVDKSLLHHDQDGRYEVHGLLRQFAAGKLAENADLHAAAHQAHARFYCRYLADRAHRLRNGGQQEAFADIRAEQDNIRTAWYTALDTRQFHLIDGAVDGWFRFAELGGSPQQGYQGLAYALQTLESGQSSGNYPDEVLPADWSVDDLRVLHARTLARHGYLMARVGGDYAHSVEELERALAQLESFGGRIAGETGTSIPDELAFAQNVLGLWLYLTGDVSRAERHIRNALQLAEETGNKVEIATAWSYLAHLAYFQGDYTDAAKLFSTSIEFYSSAGEMNRRAYALNNWGRASYGMGEYEKAQSLVQRALTIREEFNDLVGISYSLLDLGKIADYRGDYEEAERLMREGLAITQTMGNREIEARYLMALGDVALRTESADAAERYYNDARTICQEQILRRHEPIYLTGLGLAAIQRQEVDVARDLFEEGLALSIELGNVGAEAEVRLALAELDIDQDRFGDGVYHLRQCLEITIDTGARPLALAAIAQAARLPADMLQINHTPVELLSIVVQHPSTWHDIRQHAQRTLSRDTVDGSASRSESAVPVDAETLKSIAQVLIQAFAMENP